MTPPRREQHRLEDMLVAINLIREYVSLREDIRGEVTAGSIPAAVIGDAILYRFVILGEAAASVPAQTREQMPTVPWSVVVGMRNIVSHEYFQVDWEIVEATAARDLVPIEETISRYLRPGG